MRISLVQRGMMLLAKTRRRGAFGVFGAAVLLLILIQTVRLIWTLTTPIAPVGDWQPKMPAVMDHAAQKSLFASFDPFFRQQDTAPGREKVTSLPLTLFGIRGNEATGAGSAIIADSEGSQLSYLTGAEIMPGVILHAVAFDHIILSNNGSLEKLFLDQSVPAEVVGAQDGATMPAPAKQDNDGSAALNAQTLAAAISLAPRNEGGAVTGLVVSAKDDGAMLRAAGLQPGDIITKINGRPVTAPADLIGQIQPGARISIELERGAQVVPTSIMLEKP